MSTILGQNIACEAKKWIGIMEQPPGSNAGPQLEPMFQRYYEGNWDKQGKAYCAIWAWVVVNDVITRMKGTNRLPGYKAVWGNAANTVSGSRNYFTVNRTPAIGAVMYRYSWSKSGTPEPPGSGGPSGHMGIVVDVLPDGKILTVEANQGESHGIKPYEYTAAQYNDTKYGFQFIHVENTIVSSTTLDCPPVVTQPGTSPTTQIPTSPAALPGFARESTTGGGTSTGGGSSTTTTTTTGGGSSTTPGSAGGATSGGSSTSIAVKQPCDWNIPIGGRTPHYSRLQELRFASDVIGGNNTGGYSKKDRNGFAVGRQSDNDQEGGYSGVGMVTDRNGKLIVIANEDNERWTLLKKKSATEPGLLGRDYWNIRVGRHTGDGWKEKETDVLAGKRDFDGGEKSIYIPWTGQYAKVRNMQQLLQYIEANPPRNDKQPIALTYVANPIIIGDVVKFIVDTALPFALGVLKIPMSDATRTLFDAARRVVSSIASGTFPPLSEIAQLAKFITPSQYRQYVDTGAKALGQALPPGSDLLAAAKTLGLKIPTLESAVQEVRNAVEDLFNKAGASIQRAEVILKNIGANFSQVQGLIQGALNTKLLTDVENVYQQWGTEFYSSTASRAISAIPRLRPLWTSGLAFDTLLPMVPRVDFLMNKLINEATDFQGKLVTDFHRGLSFVGMGFPVPAPDMFYEMGLNALKSEALDLLRLGEKKMILPAAIPPEKRECFAKEIGNATGITVIDQLVQATSVTGGSSTTTTFVTVPKDINEQVKTTVQQTGTAMSLPVIAKGEGGAITTFSPSVNTPALPVKISTTGTGLTTLTPTVPKIETAPVIGPVPTFTPPGTVITKMDTSLPVFTPPTAPTVVVESPKTVMPGVPPVLNEPPRVTVPPPEPVRPPPTTLPPISVPPLFGPTLTPEPEPQRVFMPPAPTVGPPVVDVPPVRVDRPQIQQPPAQTEQPRPLVVPERPAQPVQQQSQRNCYPGFAPSMGIGPPIVFTMPLKPAGNDCGCGCGGGCGDDCGCNGLSDNGQRKRQRTIYRGF